MVNWIEGIMNSAGYWGVLFLMFLENVFPPIPSEIVMPLAGYIATKGDLSFWWTVAAGTAGSLLGQLPLYYLGKLIGADRLKAWSRQHGHWVALSPDEIDKSKAWFDKHGPKAVAFCRVVPTLRSVISIPAGMANMNLVSFLLYSLGGTALWTAALAYAGRLLGENFDQVERYLNPLSYAILALIVALYLWRVVKRQRELSEENKHQNSDNE